MMDATDNVTLVEDNSIAIIVLFLHLPQNLVGPEISKKMMTLTFLDILPRIS